MGRYVPRPLTEEVNVSKHSQLGQMLFLLGCAAGALLLIYVLAGVAVDQLAGYVPASWERSLGSLFNDQFPVDQSDPRAQRLQGLLDRLMPSLEEDGLDYTVGVVDDPTVNAVALPGGRIVFFSGMLDELESDDQTLFVLAHELGHLQHRDHLRKLGRGLIMLLLAQAMVGTGENSPGMVVRFVSNSLGLAYSRSQERAADLFAVDLLYKATGSAQGAVDFMRKLAMMEQDVSLPYFFRTHPGPPDRLAYVEKAVQELR